LGESPALIRGYDFLPDVDASTLTANDRCTPGCVKRDGGDATDVASRAD
jgi:hypothetical protein